MTIESSLSTERTLTAGPWRWTWGNAQLVFFLLALCAGSFSIAVSQMALALTLLTGVIRWLRTRQGLVRTGMELPTLLLIGWALLMIPLSFDPGQSLLFSKRFFVFTGLWFGAELAVDEGRRKLLLAAVLLGAVGISIVGAVGMYQQWGGLFVSRLDQVSNAMTNGALLMLVALLALGVLINRSTSRRGRLVVGVALAPILLALLMTMTRSALLGMSVGVAVMLLVARPRWLVVYVVLILAFGLTSHFYGDQLKAATARAFSVRIWGRIEPEYIAEGGNTTSRLEMWRVGWQIVQAEPWTGVGDCDLHEVAPQYYGDRRPISFGHLHSNFVHLAVIWGVPGFLLAMVFLLAQPWLLWTKWRRHVTNGLEQTPWQNSWVLGALGVTTGFFVSGLTEWYFGDAEPMFLALSFVGIALGRRATRPHESESGEAHA